jgi:accessory colonization factor AcfC
MQRAIIVSYFSDKKNNLEELNDLLSQGWKVVSQSSMGGGGSNTVHSLVILEK